MTSRRVALNGYKRLLIASRKLFSNDAYALHQSRLQLRQEFMMNKDIIDPIVLKELYKGIDEVEDMMLNNFIQGKRTEEGNYAVTLEPEKNKETTIFDPKPLTEEDLNPINIEKEETTQNLDDLIKKY